ncbi:unnamed protein product [Closterium sp. NIES-65]|nr:unnamed protein product [Closterium sp. NIES-65]
MSCRDTLNEHLCIARFVATCREKERGLDGAREAFDLAAAVAAREREQEEREEEAGEEGEELEVRDPDAAAAAAADVEKILSDARRGREDIEDGEEREEGEAEDDEDDEDGEDGAFSETASMYNDAVADEVTEEDERAIAVFLAGGGAAPRQRTLADVIMAKIQEATAGGAAGAAGGAGGGGGVRGGEGGEEAERRIPGVDEKVMEVYRGVGKLLSRYRSGKVPKAFKIVPALSNWEDVLFLTDPDSWTPAAVFAATRLFASNLNARAAQRFYRLVLLPRVRRDIRLNKKLHFALYQSLKKAVYKPAAFYKGVLLPLCQSQTCTLREAVIIGSVIQKVSIPVLHSSYFMKLLLDKKYALPYRVIDAVPDAALFTFSSDATMRPLVVTKPLEDDYRNLPEVHIGMDED